MWKVGVIQGITDTGSSLKIYYLSVLLCFVSVSVSVPLSLSVLMSLGVCVCGRCCCLSSCSLVDYLLCKRKLETDRGVPEQLSLPNLLLFAVPLKLACKYQWHTYFRNVDGGGTDERDIAEKVSGGMGIGPLPPWGICVLGTYRVKSAFKVHCAHDTAVEQGEANSRAQRMCPATKLSRDRRACPVSRT